MRVARNLRQGNLVLRQMHNVVGGSEKGLL